MTMPAADTRNEDTSRKLRNPEFARRLAIACDGNSHCPDMNFGRLVWLKDQLKAKFGTEVSLESVRKWCSGESTPKHDKVAQIAELLGVDLAWLHVGIDQGLTPREIKKRKGQVSGVINLVAGLIELDGGHTAFPENDGPVDLHAIIRAAKYDFRVILADSNGIFAVPKDDGGAIMLGVVRTGFSVEIYEITSEALAAGKPHGRIVEVDAKSADLRAIESFSQRI
ncbi:helix-turn-helix transcriptional regulator [Sphingomonas sp. RB3P16]|uniref:helix-turn-helix transcriptional regulator n=1 Tax=Parasphingomonas frigoris TaxID=3096163 RepID=UPI002FCB83E1